MIEDFVMWKNHAITRAVLAEFKARAEFLTQCVLDNAGRDPIQDATHAGYIKACKDFLESKFDDLEETHD